MKEWVKNNLLFLYHKLRHRHLVKFWYSSRISYNSLLEGRNIVCKNSRFHGILGLGSYIGDNSHVIAEVGKFTSIGPNCNFITSTHPYKRPFVSTSRQFTALSSNSGGNTFAKYRKFKDFLYYDEAKCIVNKIGNDCWIGANVTLIGGVIIHDGAVVLANAIVTKDVPPFSIVGGVPAKIIGYRYSQEEIKIIQKSKWWMNSEEWFEKNWELLTDIDKFKEYYSKI